MKEKTSLERSHSKVSNFKLTLICFFAALAVSILWVGLAVIGYEPYRIYGIIGASAGLLLSLFFIFLISKFTR